MPELTSPIRIRNFTVKNRVVLPPLVVCNLHRDKQVNDAVLNHYEAFARGGCGTVIQEATCVLPEGLLAGAQLGIWEDSQIDGMKRIAERVLPYGALLLMQIHYASKQGEPDNVMQVGPSEYTDNDGMHRALTTDEVERIRDGFVEAALRAEKAGYHGVELHGCHGYLLCAFMNSKYNHRQDRYGELTLLPREIISGIRQSVSTDFILTCRIGGINPDIETGMANCREIEAAGVDILHVSFGMGQTEKLTAPEGFPFSPLAWLGCEVKRWAKVPVIAVGNLNDPEKAKKLIAEGWADFAAVGRGNLVDPEWTNKAFVGLAAKPCYDCNAGCRWFNKHEKCPGLVPPAKSRPASPS
jgi:NADPH2 dehydrogenase